MNYTKWKQFKKLIEDNNFCLNNLPLSIINDGLTYEQYSIKNGIYIKYALCGDFIEYCSRIQFDLFGLFHSSLMRFESCFLLNNSTSIRVKGIPTIFALGIWIDDEDFELETVINIGTPDDRIEERTKDKKVLELAKVFIGAEQKTKNKEDLIVLDYIQDNLEIGKIF